MFRRGIIIPILAVAIRFLPTAALAQSGPPCPRYSPGSTIVPPEDLYSLQGVLQLNLSYQTAVDANGNTLYCFVNSDGAQSPTLHVRPGDQLIINFTNGLPPATASNEAVARRRPQRAMAGMVMGDAASNSCGALVMDSTSVNIHYHGMNVAPTCHQDEVINTLIDSGQSFQYDVNIPPDEPPGLYWYHPHVHGISEGAVQGGASGAIIVEGIENLNPAVLGLPEQVMVIRDNPVPGAPAPGGAIPSWDISLNYIPIPYPNFTPAVVAMKPGEKQFWRVVNASADTIIDLQLQYDGAAQPLKVVALDGVPTGSQDGKVHGTVLTQTDILLAPAARAEFIVAGPASTIQNATLLTLGVDTGPAGASNPQRPIALVQTSPAAPEPPLTAGTTMVPSHRQRFAGLATAKVTAVRTLYFSEVVFDPSKPASGTNYFITVDGATPQLFSPNNPPAIVTTQGSVENWTIENRSTEAHDFHIHQIHFLLVAQNGVPVENGQYLDTIHVPYWTGSGPYPSVTLRMDFRGSDVGSFVYHCHILNHEDNGMMAIVQVNPAPPK